MKVVNILLLGLVFFINGCSTKYDVIKKEQEPITALILSENKLYAVGQTNDYQFIGDIVKDLYKFAQSPYANRLLYSSAYLEITDKKKVSGTYTVYIATTTFSDVEKKELKEKYDFRNTTYLPDKALEDLKQAGKEEKPETVSRTFKATGDVVTVENRQILIERYALKEPLMAQITYIETSKDVAGDMGAVLMAPVAIIAIVPMMLVWGIACSASSDGC